MFVEKVNSPADLKKLTKNSLPKLCEEIRHLIINTVSKTGGHLASNLATVELITAIHYVFDIPRDKLVFDVGHQSYTHKILTGRRDRFHTLRQYQGISGFPDSSESKYDVFTTGHSSTAVSVALGMAVARDHKREAYKVIAFIGDGSLSGGLCYEGLNNAGVLGKDLVVILNDNRMFISYPVGAVANYLAKILTFGLIKEVEKGIDLFLRKLKFAGRVLLRIAKRIKFLLLPGMLFEELGFTYLGPVDGHNIFLLIDILSKIKKFKGPVLLHVLTKKGKGYKYAEQNPIKFHGITKFEIESGNLEKEKKLTFTDIFSDTLIELAKKRKEIVAITAAMPEGTGLQKFARAFPKRYYDVGIAEQHAIAFAAGLAKNGLKPLFAVYSTFLQRGFDQLIHDVAIQKLPVVFAIDRAGIVGGDGVTHCGNFDLSYLRIIPNLIVMAPKDENELRDMLYSAFEYNSPTAIRYPRGECLGLKLKKNFDFIPIGKSELLKPGEDIFLLAIGNLVYTAIEAAKLLAKKYIEVGVINMRFVKPLDVDILNTLKKTARILLTLEENTAIGGFGSAISEFFSDSFVKVYSIGLPDKFIEHGSQTILRNKYGLTPETIAEKVERIKFPI